MFNCEAIAVKNHALFLEIGLIMYGFRSLLGANFAELASLHSHGTGSIEVEICSEDANADKKRKIVLTALAIT